MKKIKIVFASGMKFYKVLGIEDKLFQNRESAIKAFEALQGTTFKNREECNEMKNKKMTPYLAVAIAEGFCEGEGASQDQQIEAWQYIVDTGLAWTLQGRFGRTASALIEAGVVHKKGVIK